MRVSMRIEITDRNFPHTHTLYVPNLLVLRPNLVKLEDAGIVTAL